MGPQYAGGIASGRVASAGAVARDWATSYYRENAKFFTPKWKWAVQLWTACA
jgi:hypothetical protein